MECVESQERFGMVEVLVQYISIPSSLLELLMANLWLLELLSLLSPRVRTQMKSGYTQHQADF